VCCISVILAATISAGPLPQRFSLSAPVFDISSVVLTRDPVPQPSPTATPLRTIYHETISPFCTQLRNNIGGSVIGLLHNDEWVESAKETLAQMSRDWVFGGARVAMDRVKLDRVIGGLVRNLTIIDDLLRKTAPSADPTGRLSTMHAQLTEVADQQLEVLNILGIVLDSTEINAQLEDFYRHNPRASRAAIANVRQRYDHDSMVYRDPVLGQVTGVFGDSPFTDPLLYLIANDLQTHQLESVAAKSVLEADKGCASTVPLAPPVLPYTRPDIVPVPSPQPSPSNKPRSRSL
jgi:hypothetical protein